jgi:hypothetical protein
MTVCFHLTLCRRREAAPGTITPIDAWRRFADTEKYRQRRWEAFQERFLR